MRAPILIPSLMTLALSLAACEPESQQQAAAVIQAARSAGTAAQRKAIIKAALAPICPAPLSDADLERAAAFVEATKDREAVWVVSRLSRMDRETRICRGAG